MTQDTVLFLLLAVLIAFSLPALYRKKKNGDLTLWGKDRDILGRKTIEKAAPAAEAPAARNGSQKDILQFVSSLMKLVRKNGWYIILPGSLSDGRNRADLSLVLVTQQRVIGLKCYGYGGTLTGRGRSADWTQKLGDSNRQVRSPLPEQAKQQAALALLLPQLAASQVEVFSVFTTPGVQLIDCNGLGCYTSISFLEKLQTSADCSGSLHPKELGTALEALKCSAPANAK